ncbi:conserved Plasmodium protein, unknown function [Plasmodium knowlesi strain H]|uniref:Uncharacterized protein n=3 Tax=Plasmodium knowlesi TaxID=5850 RepID=A0A5K1U430_PLAKH|nr:conserved Plasmodium protein, unknown function [Plasmodium knowlesi strain H]OTN68505.1 Uncharacterized protein PKNOH_S02294500 [Plasmodium knowlesi]CAA9986450.1 conserved Plasmodium protein, unknown function [Plasmodium knowlesi strain H]SBO24301.1 conserved Plasmodium protein, unknown function [Plasmodium knowlesi strain H]SBO29698.1 conserved Plasmodium protein, unknown function [Plasmodium knowlesi strain H]VVS75924.1 conserved Plasmodium protein, unknown function [Plasmodium knowlesi s|eukprot:XP_002261001.1 hypothetical protein, conserved in Plasmodium species [Plasmodium knowlesi strain H]
MFRGCGIMRRMGTTGGSYSRGTEGNSLFNEESLKKAFVRISIGSPSPSSASMPSPSSSVAPPRAKINSVLNFLLSSKILHTKWTKLGIIDELYKRRVDNKLSFHLNVLYGLGSKGLHLRRKGIISPVLFQPLVDYNQFVYIVQVMKIADKERQAGTQEQADFIRSFFRG